MLQNLLTFVNLILECAYCGKPWQFTACYLQIWDFNLGRSRNHNEKSAHEIGFGSNNGGFMIKSYSDMLKEISCGTTKDLEDIYDSGYGAAAEDIMSTNICQVPSKNVSYSSLCLSTTFSMQRPRAFTLLLKKNKIHGIKCIMWHTTMLLIARAFASTISHMHHANF